MTNTWSTIQPFVYGGTAGMFATTCVQPIDMVKVQIQIAGEGAGKKSINRSPITIVNSIIAKDGFLSLYRGLSAGLVRQATYTTTRMGLFRTFSNQLKREDGSLSFTNRAFAGLAAGGLGAIVGTPSDLALVRMQADSSLPIDQRRNYKNVVDALTRISREEGVAGLFKGCGPTVTRAMSLNVGMLSTYDQAKDVFTAQFGPGKAIYFASSLVSGFFASAMSLPLDFVKTRIQRQRPGPDGKLPYDGMIDCITKVMREEGALAFYRGFPVYYVRIAPHAMITLLALEVLRATFGDDTD